MRFKLRTLLIVIAILPLPFLIWPAFVNWAFSFDTAMDRHYHQIECGQSCESAIALLGEPYETTDYFSRALATYESDFSTADVAKCNQFMAWRNGANWFYSIGIDKDGVIVIKAQGHS